MTPPNGIKTQIQNQYTKLSYVMGGDEGVDGYLSGYAEPSDLTELYTSLKSSQNLYVSQSQTAKYNAYQAIISLIDNYNMGSLTSLTTSNTVNIVEAINSVSTSLEDYALATDVGARLDLSTTVTSTVVDGINSIVSDLGNYAQSTYITSTLDNYELASDVGATSGLSTTVTSTVVNGINSIVSNLGNYAQSSYIEDALSNYELASDVGATSGLSTTVRTTIVAGINSIVNNLGNYAQSTYITNTLSSYAKTSDIGGGSGAINFETRAVFDCHNGDPSIYIVESAPTDLSELASAHKACRDWAYQNFFLGALNAASSDTSYDIGYNAGSSLCYSSSSEFEDTDIYNPGDAASFCIGLVEKSINLNFMPD